jgi:hypothetical protein
MISSDNICSSTKLTHQYFTHPRCLIQGRLLPNIKPHAMITKRVQSLKLGSIQHPIPVQYYSGVVNRMDRSIGRSRACEVEVGRSIDWSIRSIGRSVDHAHLRFRFHLGCRVVLWFSVIRAGCLVRYSSYVLNRIDRSIGQSVDRSIGRSVDRAPSRVRSVYRSIGLWVDRSIAHV